MNIKWGAEGPLTGYSAGGYSTSVESNSLAALYGLYSPPSRILYPICARPYPLVHRLWGPLHCYARVPTPRRRLKSRISARPEHETRSRPFPSRSNPGLTSFVSSPGDCSAYSPSLIVFSDQKRSSAIICPLHRGQHGQLGAPPLDGLFRRQHHLPQPRRHGARLAQPLTSAPPLLAHVTVSLVDLATAYTYFVLAQAPRLLCARDGQGYWAGQYGRRRVPFGEYVSGRADGLSWGGRRASGSFGER